MRSRFPPRFPDNGLRDAMTVLVEARFPRTLDGLVSRFARKSARGTRLQAWTFDDPAARRAAEARLAVFGVEARLRSAYKPLLHFFLEDLDRADLVEVVVRHPVHPAAAPNRFRLETYPLAGMIGGARLRFEPREKPGFDYDVTLAYADGRRETQRVFAPNREHVDNTGARQVSPTGWLRLDGDNEGERLETEFERLFETAVRSVAEHAWGQVEPFFEELSIRATLPFRETPLPAGGEVVSLVEALHEDLYFSLLEVFGRKAGLAPGDRRVRPGQIAPAIARAQGDATLRIETRSFADAAEPKPAGPFAELAGVSTPLSAIQVAAELEKVGGDAFTVHSRAGRPVRARHVGGSDRPILISGGQHANEPSGIVGALRAAQALADRPGAHFAVSPLENPDGHALHLRLCRDNPHHMHHAARYTAFGDDLGHRRLDAPGEQAIRVEALRRTGGVLLHVNLHGYPAHEWTRPLSGYIPQGFAAWTLPKGFFLIMEHREGWRNVAVRLAEAVTLRLAGVPGLLAFTQAQLALCDAHTGEPGLPLVNGFPCRFGIDAGGIAPLTLVTEYPDETLQGEAFVDAHEAQTQTVLAAYEALQAIDVGA